MPLFLYHNGHQLSCSTGKTIAVTSQSIFWFRNCGPEAGVWPYWPVKGTTSMLSTPLTAFACSGPHWKLFPILFMSFASISLLRITACPFSSLLPSVPTWYPSRGCLAQKENAGHATGWSYSSGLRALWGLRSCRRCRGWCCRRKDAQGSAEKALGILSALDHCQWPLLKRKKKMKMKKFPSPSKSPHKVRSFTAILKIQLVTPNSNSK